MEDINKDIKELEENQIIKNEKIRNGQPVIANTRLTVLDVLYLMTEFIKKHEEEFRKDYADISINQIISAIDYFIDNSIPVSLVEEKIEEYKQRIEKYNEYKEQGKETDVEFYENMTNTAIVQILQELLEKRK